MSIADDIKYQLKYGNVITKLIVINILVFVFMGLTNLIIFIGTQSIGFLTNFIAVPSSIKQFLLKPYTLITYQFGHSGFIHLLFNMLMLFFAGRIFTDFFSKKDTWKVYLWGGVAGAILYLACYNLLPVFINNKREFELIGASASVLALLFAATAYAPNMQISIWGLFSLKLLWLSFAYLILDLISIPTDNPGGHIAHIGGAIFGWIYAKYRQQNLNWFSFNFLQTKKPQIKYSVEINKSKTTVSKSKRNSPSQDEIDAILDKISKSGYERLSKEEKDILFKASQD